MKLTQEDVGKVYETRGVISMSMDMSDTKNLLSVVGINPVNGKFICVDVKTGLITEYFEDGCAKSCDTRPYDLVSEYTPVRPIEEVMADMVECIEIFMAPERFISVPDIKALLAEAQALGVGE